MAIKTGAMLTLLIILSSLLLLALLGLLFSPLIIRVNTRQNLYQLSWGFARVQFIPAADGGRFQLQYAFWHWDFPLLKLLAKPYRPKKLKPKKPSTPKEGKGFFTLHRLGRMIRSFRLRFFYLDLDTDDFVHNAYWYPLFKVLSTPTRKLNINFNGRNQCAFELHNQVYKVLMALIF